MYTQRMWSVPDVNREHAHLFTSYRDKLKRQLDTGLLHDSSVDPDGREGRDVNDFQCPICLNDASFAVSTSCSHVYCCQCMLQYWRHQTQMEMMTCPTCRGKISSLRVRFTQDEWEATSGEATAYLSSLTAYNRRFSTEQKCVSDYLISLRIVGGHYISELFNIRGLIWLIYFRMLWLMCSFGLNFYFLYYDHVPDVCLTILDYTDRVWLALVPFVYLSTLMRRFRENQDEDV